MRTLSKVCFIFSLCQAGVSSARPPEGLRRPPDHGESALLMLSEDSFLQALDAYPLLIVLFYAKVHDLVRFAAICAQAGWREALRLLRPSHIANAVRPLISQAYACTSLCVQSRPTHAGRLAAV